MIKFLPSDIIAIILILSYIILIIFRADTSLQGAVMLVIGFYFGNEHGKDNNTTL